MTLNSKRICRSVFSISSFGRLSTVHFLHSQEYNKVGVATMVRALVFYTSGAALYPQKPRFARLLRGPVRGAKDKRTYTETKQGKPAVKRKAPNGSEVRR